MRVESRTRGETQQAQRGAAQPEERATLSTHPPCNRSQQALARDQRTPRARSQAASGGEWRRAAAARSREQADARIADNEEPACHRQFVSGLLLWHKHAKFGTGPFLAKTHTPNLGKTPWSVGVSIYREKLHPKKTDGDSGGAASPAEGAQPSPLCAPLNWRFPVFVLASVGCCLLVLEPLLEYTAAQPWGSTCPITAAGYFDICACTRVGLHG